MTIHIGLIGAGNISQTHARAARAIHGVQIAAVFGSNARKLWHFAAEHAACYTDYEKFLAHRPISRAARANAKCCLASPSTFLAVAPSQQQRP